MNTNHRIANVLLTSRVRQLLVAVLSVTFGISMYVFMNSFMAGVNNTQTEITFTSMPHIKIYNDIDSDVPPILPVAQDGKSLLIVKGARPVKYTEGIRNADALRAALARIEGIRGSTPQINQNVFLRNGVSRTSATLSGIKTTDEELLFNTSRYITEGDLFDLDKRPDGIILGSSLAKSIGVSRGNNITVSTSDGATKAFTVIGLITTGAQAADKSRALVSIQSARRLFSKNRSFATEVMVNVFDYNDARAIAARITRLTDYRVEAWQEGNDQLSSANLLRDIIAVAVSLTILLVAGFGIYNIMNMTVNEKIKDIAILKAMGFSGLDIVEIFLTQSIVIGIIGGLSGLVLGNIVVRIVDIIPFRIATLDTLPVEYNAIDYVLAISFGIVTTTLAGYFPARKAARIDPVEILRG